MTTSWLTTSTRVPGPVAVEVGQPAAQAQDHVGPGLPAGGPVVELALPAPPLGLLRVAGLHAGEGQSVQDAELAVAEPLVDTWLGSASPHALAGQAGGLLGPEVGGAESGAPGVDSGHQGGPDGAAPDCCARAGRG